MDRKKGRKEKGEEAEKLGGRAKKAAKGRRVVLRLSASEKKITEGEIYGRGKPGGKEVGKGGGRPGGRKWERGDRDQEKGSAKGRRETSRKEVEREEGDH